MSEDMANITKHEVELNHPEEKLLFFVVGDGEDRYGNTAQVDAFKLEYSMDDLKRINWDNFSGQKLLNLATFVDEFKAGETLVAKYCEENRESSEQFCAAGAQAY